MIKKTFLAIITLLLLATSCTSSSEENTQEQIQITDANGRIVEFDELPERIVIGGNGALMIVDALLAFPEGQERLIAYTKTDQGKGSFTEALLPEATTEIIEDRTSVEAIAAFQPDAVLLKSYMKDLGTTLEEINIPVIYLNFETYEQYQLDMNNLGILLDNESRADELLGYYSNIVNSVEAQTNTINNQDKPKILFAYYDSKDGAISLKVPPMNWAQTIMLQRAGGIPVWDDIELEAKWTIVSFEQIAAWNPEIIFLTSYFSDVDEVKESLLADKQWQELEAVKNGQLIAYPMAFYSWDQPHTRWGLVQQWSAYQMHPELFGDFNFRQEAINFYQLFYHWDEAKYEELIQTRLQGDTP